MGLLARWVTTLAAAVVLGIGVASCGDDGSDPEQANGTSAKTEQQEETTARSPGGEQDSKPSAKPDDDSAEPAAPMPTHEDSGGGVEQFRVKGGDNSVQEFGAEASASDFEEAAAALHGFLDARAAGDWATACEHVASSIVESLEQLASRSEELKGKDCAALMAALSGEVPAPVRKEAAIADVGALRVEGEQGFLLYRGARDTNYAVTMANEDGEWKVASLAGFPLS